MPGYSGIQSTVYKSLIKTCKI
uniref:Uncharacterized protein n=1 Tax=Anguilla anguilla TaxID=7936 RepID=A0A0E9SA15_ANGAN